jgi:ribulose-5-phosphate 4-epimerase/fuculose-1-phosphate aldolase
MESILVDKLILANRILDEAELTIPFGHASARLPGQDLFLISRAIPPALVTEKDILVVDLKGKILEGEGRWHGESWIHICIYRMRPEIEGAVHTHSLHVTALATAEVSFVPATIFGMTFAGAKIYKKAGLINSEDRGLNMARLMGKDAAVLLKGHGASVAGRNLEEATARAIMMEEAARIQLLASTVAKVKPYDERQLKEFRRELAEQAVRNNRPAGLFERVWEYYKWRVEEKAPHG